MPGIVVDASVTLSWCFPDEQTPASISVLDRLKAGDRALEVLNTLLVGERRGRITAEQTRVFFDTPSSTMHLWRRLAAQSRSSAATIVRPRFPSNDLAANHKLCGDREVVPICPHADAWRLHGTATVRERTGSPHCADEDRDI
jgi:hypothetical protein